MKSNRNLSEMTETERTGFRYVSAPTDLDSRLRGNDDISVFDFLFLGNDGI
ncbi:putative phage associated protein [Neisseria meningitidis]|nr:putative phage associated protein [Neisseria meningitidis]